MNLLTILVLLSILLVIAYIIFAYVYKPWSLSSSLLEYGPINLSTPYIYSFFEKMISSDNFTITFYVKPDAINRTLSETDQDINPLMVWERTFSFGLTPIRSKKDMNTGTIIKINRVGDESEAIICPALPYQKWTYVGISLEGRRLDVSYNGRIVVSKILGGMPFINKGGRLISGSANCNGKVAVVSFNSRRMSAEEIMIDYVSTSNTRGEPYGKVAIPGLGGISNPFSCPAGILCMKPSEPPKLTGMSWDTPFG